MPFLRYLQLLALDSKLCHVLSTLADMTIFCMRWKPWQRGLSSLSLMKG